MTVDAPRDPDEVELEERNKGFDLKSLKYCYSEAKDALQRHVATIDTLESKATSMLQFNGTIAAALFALIALIRDVASPVALLLAGISGIILIISGLCALNGRKQLRLQIAPSPRRLAEKYIVWEEDNAKYKVLFEMLHSIDGVKNLQQEMQLWIDRAHVLLALSLLLLAGALGASIFA